MATVFYPSHAQTHTRTLPWLVQCSMRFNVRDDSVVFSVNRTQAIAAYRIELILLTTYTHSLYAPLFWSSMNDTIEVCARSCAACAQAVRLH